MSRKHNGKVKTRRFDAGLAFLAAISLHFCFLVGREVVV